MMRFFNTAGPCNPVDHYMIPPLDRVPEVRGLIDAKAYFVLHAPRQTGKTTFLRALATQLTLEGKYTALYFSCEAGEPAGDDYVQAQLAILNDLERWASRDLSPELRPPPRLAAPDLQLVGAALDAWARSSPRPLVLFFDEIDALRGEGLRSVLRQLRAGATGRPISFPQSVVLCGLRDVRDYKIDSGGDPARLASSSPFNIKIESLRLGDFSPDEVGALYGQHTDETGQVFAPEAIERAWKYACGQPWLTNALAREVIEKMRVPVTEAITADHMDQAKERLIIARATHLDSLVDKLRDPRVRRIIEPIFSGEIGGLDATYNDDVSYVIDLGLVRRQGNIQIANPIYREVIARVLSTGTQDQIIVDRRSFIRPDGRIEVATLLREFAKFWRQHGDVLEQGVIYTEAAAQLVFMAYLQRVVNGDGYVEREVGAGRGRIDVHIRWPYIDSSGRRVWQVEAFELKVWRKRRVNPLEDGLEQLEVYLERLSLSEGTLVIFDQRKASSSLTKRTKFEEARTPKRMPVTVLWA